MTKGTEHRLKVTSSFKEAFEKVKVSACKWILMAPFDPRRLTLLQTDSSGFGWGGLLMQFDPVRGCNRVVLVFSKRWDDAAKKYLAHALEVTSLILTLKRHERYIRNTPLELHTDSFAALDMADFELDPVETFYARCGVAHMHETVGELCGDALPHVVFGGRLSLGRAGLILSYEGKSLNKVRGYKTKQTYEKVKCAVEKLHAMGVPHGEIARRNIVTKSNCDIKLIDLGSAYQVDATGSELAERREMVHWRIYSTRV